MAKAQITSGDIVQVILNNPSYFKIFYAYAKKQFCHEMLDFYVAVREYKNTPNKTKAIEIIDKFFVGTDSQLNNASLDSSKMLKTRNEYVALRQKATGMNFLKRIWTSGNRKASPNLFDDALTYVLGSIVTHLYSIFEVTDAGKALAEAIVRDLEKYHCLQQVLMDTNML